MRLPADTNLRRAEPIRRLVQIDERGDFLVVRLLPQPRAADASAQREHGNIDIRRIRSLDRHFDDRRLAAELRHEAAQDAFALDRDERRRGPERHAHLKARDLSDVVLRILRQHIHAIAGSAAEPPLALAGDPDRRRRTGNLTAAVARLRAHEHFTRSAGRDFAHEQALRVRLALALRFEFRVLLRALICVEAADQTLAIRVARRAEQRRGDLSAGDRLAVQIEHDDAKAHLLAARRPALGPNADVQLRWHEMHAARRREQLAVRIGVFQLRGQHRRVLDRGQIRDGHARRALLVERDGQDLRLPALRGRCFAFTFEVEVVAAAFVHLHAFAHRRAAEAEVVVARMRQRPLLDDRAHFHGHS